MKHPIAKLRQLLSDTKSSLDTLKQATPREQSNAGDYLLSVLLYEIQIEQTIKAILILENYEEI